MKGGGAKKDPLLGQVIAGRYEVTRFIGKGGMGAIYEVRHRKLKRTFAMKRLAAALADDPEAMARFQREADVVAGLRHPNIVEIVDWETLDDGAPCMIMEYLKGEDLAARLKRGGPLPWNSLAQVADQILAALMVAHRAGIVHRDLKPQNVFLAQDDSGEEHAKLLDFGVSKIRHSESLMTADDRLLGTPAYMSPEQADGKPDQIGPATDVWAMGAILFEMATAKQAFVGVTTPSVLYRIVHGEPEPLAAHRSDAPAAFVDVVGRAISRDALRRIETIDVLRRQLREALTTVAPGAFAEPLRAARPDGEESTDVKTSVMEKVEEPTTVTPPPTTLSRAAGQRSVSGARKPTVQLWTRRQWSIVALLGTALVVMVGVGVMSKSPAVIPTTTTPAVLDAGPPPPPPAQKPVVTPLPADLVVHTTPPNALLTFDQHPIEGNRIKVQRDHYVHFLHVSARGFESLDFQITPELADKGPLKVVLRRLPPRQKKQKKPDDPYHPIKL